MNAPAKITLAVCCGARGIPQPVDAWPLSPSTAWAGIWRLNLSNSKFSGGVPRAETRTITVSRNKMLVRSIGVDPSGKRIRFNYSVTLDGRSHPLIGNPDGDRIAVRLVSPRQLTIQARRMHKLSARATSEVSADCLVMDRRRLNAAGGTSNEILVYDRVR